MKSELFMGDAGEAVISGSRNPVFLWLSLDFEVDKSESGSLVDMTGKSWR